MNLLAEILSSKIRAEIFRMLFGVSDKPLHMREIERRSGFAIGTVQKELQKLIRLDLVMKKRDGNRVYYRANEEHPLYPDIRDLVLKTIGLVDILRSALLGHSGLILAFVFGSIARHEEKAVSDVDLMVIGNLGLRKVTALLSGASGKIGREINPHVLTKEEFIRRKSAGDHFLSNVLQFQKLFVIGNRHDLEAMG